MMTENHLKAIRRAALVGQVTGYFNQDPAAFNTEDLARARAIWEGLKGLPEEERHDRLLEEVDRILTRREKIEDAGREDGI